MKTLLRRVKVWNKTAKIRSALRQVFRWSPLPVEAKRLARVGRGSYQCALCSGLFGPREIQVDHVEPVTPVGWDSADWTVYVDRLFNGKLRVLCVGCHAKCTKQQSDVRKYHRRMNKKTGSGN